jgi:hypothetical protein
MRATLLLPIVLVTLFGCGESEHPFGLPDAGPPKLMFCVGASRTDCTQLFFNSVPTSIANYDTDNGMLFVRIIDLAYVHSFVAGKVATLRAFVNASQTPSFVQDAVVGLKFEAEFHVPYCSLLLAPQSEVRLDVTISDPALNGVNIARPILSCSVPPPAECASVCTQ